jgi:putative selenium metabolism protein SsnA
VLLKNATLATLEPPSVDRGDLRIEGEVIDARGSLAPRAGESVLDLDGALVLPGLVNAHTHLYSALARGMPGPSHPPRSFVEMLERIWWRLDRALDEESVYLSGLVGAIEAVRSGTTLLFDHHASPSFIPGSLEALRHAIEQVGLRACLCYETTDRNGPAGRDAAVAENRRFLETLAGARVRGLVGAHASFTLGDETLARLAALVHETGSGFHVHAAEDPVDVRDARERHGSGVVERFSRHGLLGPHSLLAHGVHLSPQELAQAQEQGAWIIHNPRSNMNNHVGHAATTAFHNAALGTDGMDEDMLAEARAAFLKMRDAGRDDAASAAVSMLAGGHRLAGSVFRLPLGRLDAGTPADLAVFDYGPPTPLTSENLASHLLFGLDRSHVRSVVVAGRFVLRDRRLTSVDEQAVFARARPAATALWERMARLSTPPLASPAPPITRE